MDYLLNETLKDDLYWYFSVLNLIINGLPSKPPVGTNWELRLKVLNLIINGLPSKLLLFFLLLNRILSFKPYYKWITF